MGLNTGPVILCDIGAAEARIDLTTIGDTVNLAARLESAAKQYGLDNLVSEFSLKAHTGRFASRSIDLIRVKGKEHPVEVFELLGASEKQTAKQATLIEAFHAAVAEYRAGNFGKAEALFAKSLELEAHSQSLNPSCILRERARKLAKKPPEKWDGVWTLAEK
jgi:adenylate cyclase